MKKIILSVVYIMCAWRMNAQTDLQTSIKTEKGIITVSKTSRNRDMITIPAAYWDEISSGTKFTSVNLPASIPRYFCIQISDKTRSHCNSGIGFSCGLYDCAGGSHPFPIAVNNRNRICSVTVIKKNDGAVKIIFNDRVDWQSLEFSP